MPRQKVELKTAKDKLSYSIGFDMGSSIKRNEVDVDPNIVTKAIKDALSGGKPLMTEQEMRDSINAFQKEMVAKQQERTKLMGEKNKKEGAAFLAENAKKEGVKTLPSGLQYLVLTEGKGKQPKATDTVTVQYRGTLHRRHRIRQLLQARPARDVRFEPGDQGMDRGRSAHERGRKDPAVRPVGARLWRPRHRGADRTQRCPYIRDRAAFGRAGPAG